MSEQKAPADLQPIPGFSSYQIGANGDLWSFFGKTPKLLRPSKHVKDGYLKISITADSRRTKHMKIHVLLLLAFVGPRPDGMVGCHNDDDRLNNQLSNLRWDTWAANRYDAIENGRLDANRFFTRGIKLSMNIANEIRQQSELGCSRKELANRFNVSVLTIRRVLNNLIWKPSSGRPCAAGGAS